MDYSAVTEPPPLQQYQYPQSQQQQSYDLSQSQSQSQSHDPYYAYHHQHYEPSAAAYHQQYGASSSIAASAHQQYYGQYSGYDYAAAYHQQPQHVFRQDALPAQAVLQDPSSIPQPRGAGEMVSHSYPSEPQSSYPVPPGLNPAAAAAVAALSELSQFAGRMAEQQWHAKGGGPYAPHHHQSYQHPMPHGALQMYHEDLQTMKQIGGGFERDNLYYLSQSPHKPSALATTSSIQLHRRLGHPSISVLRRQFPDIPESKSLECEACQLGKHHRWAELLVLDLGGVRYVRTFTARDAHIKDSLLDTLSGGKRNRGGGRRGGALSRGGGGRGNFKQPTRTDSRASDSRARGRGRHMGRGGGRQSAMPTMTSASGKEPVSASAPAPPRRPILPVAWCDICRVDCNSLEILEQHKNGKRHKKTVQRVEEMEARQKLLAEIEAKNTTESLNQNLSSPRPVSESQSEGSEQHDAKKQGVEDNLGVQVEDNSADDNKKEKEQQKENINDQSGGEKVGPTAKLIPHVGSLKKHRIVGVGRTHPFKRKMGMFGRGGKRLRYSEHMDGKPPERPKAQPVFCTLCNITCDTAAVFERHVAGKKHMSNMKRNHGQEAIYESSSASDPQNQPLVFATQGVGDPSHILQLDVASGHHHSNVMEATDPHQAVQSEHRTSQNGEQVDKVQTEGQPPTNVD